MKQFHGTLQQKIETYSVPVPESGCWLWTRAVNQDGYGRVSARGKYLSAHRVSYEVFKGEIPAGQYVLHACDTPGCVNPAHLRIGAQSDNMADCISKGRHKGGRSHCPNGHPYAGANLYVSPDGSRCCRKCRAETVARLRERARLASINPASPYLPTRGTPATPGH
jgi:hypothetical protein